MQCKELLFKSSTSFDLLVSQDCVLGITIWSPKSLTKIQKIYKWKFP